MSTANSPIFDAALALPETERAELALRLWESLDPTSQAVTGDPEWIAEIVAVQKSIRSGNYISYDADETIRRARNALAQREPS